MLFSWIQNRGFQARIQFESNQSSRMFSLYSALVEKFFHRINQYNVEKRKSRMRRAKLADLNRQLKRLFVEAKLNNLDRDELAELIRPKIETLPESKRCWMQIISVAILFVLLFVSCNPCQRFSYKLGRQLLFKVCGSKVVSKEFRLIVNLPVGKTLGLDRGVSQPVFVAKLEIDPLGLATRSIFEFGTLFVLWGNHRDTFVQRNHRTTLDISHCKQTAIDLQWCHCSPVASCGSIRHYRSHLRCKFLSSQF